MVGRSWDFAHPLRVCFTPAESARPSGAQTRTSTIIVTMIKAAACHQ